MLETWKMDNKKIRKAPYCKPTSIKYVTGTRDLDNIPEVQVCHSSVVKSNHIR